MHRLSFTHAHSYAGRDAGITVPVVLLSSEKLVDLVASLDTGASHCLFESGYATELGLDLTAGLLTRFRTANSSFDAYGHEVGIDVLGIVTHSLVYFSPSRQSARTSWDAQAGWIGFAWAWSITTARSTWPLAITNDRGHQLPAQQYAASFDAELMHRLPGRIRRERNIR